MTHSPHFSWTDGGIHRVANGMPSVWFVWRTRLFGLNRDYAIREGKGVYTSSAIDMFSIRSQRDS